MSQTSNKVRLFLAVLAVVVGVFMVGVAPFLIPASRDRVMTALVKVPAQKPAYASGIMLFSALYPLYRGIIFITVITLMVIVRSIRQGKGWTFPVGLLAWSSPVQFIGVILLFIAIYKIAARKVEGWL